jgi:hypothetical protein
MEDFEDKLVALDPDLIDLKKGKYYLMLFSPLLTGALVQEPIIYLLLHLMRVITKMSRMNLTDTNKKVMYETSLFCYVVRINYLPATVSFSCFPGLNAGTFPAAI